MVQSRATAREGVIADRWRWKATGLLNTLCDALAAEQPLWLLLVGSLLASLAYCAWQFDADFLLGRSAFWTNPRGIVGTSANDIASSLSGYFYFQRDVWRLPLFHVSKLGAPSGTNIIFTDSIPWVALAGRLVFRVTGSPVNLYGVWTAFCFVASGICLTALVAKLGQRNLASATMATIAGLCMPALLARWGHTALMAQFEITLALIFYLGNRRCGRASRLFVGASALALLALWTHAYIFAMVCAIALATIAQAAFEGALPWRTALAVQVGMALLLAAVMDVSGYLQPHGSLADGGFGYYSMNLLSPIVPQRSGLLIPLRTLIVDGTGGQYEGFSYLGGGVVLLLLLTLSTHVQTLRRGVRRQPWLVALFLGLTLFALSNEVYLGPYRLLHVPLPDRILQLAAIFRSSGRFFWPVIYAVTGVAIATAIPRYGRRGVLLLCVAALLQWIDTAPLRDALATRIREPANPLVDLPAWQSAIAHHRSLRVLPQYSCLTGRSEWNALLSVQLQLLAARADRPINSVYAARYTADCAEDRRIDGTPQPGTGELSVFLNEFPGFARMRALAATSSSCQAGPDIVVCSDIPKEAAALAALAQTVK